MANTGKDTASFFENGTTEQFDFCYKLYPEVLKLKAEKRNKKPQELIRLDEWYQNVLPKLIKERGKDAHMVYDELVQTMKWKQARGKFYPQLNYLVKVNTPRAVVQETKKAFRKLPNLEQAITALSNLKGVGTTMASALLAAACPDSAPFMADECLMAIPEIEGIDYTTKEYLNFVQHIQSTVTRLNTQAGGDKPVWSPHRVELALWAHYVANDLSPELLDQMPSGKGGGVSVASKANGASDNENVRNVAGDDTNDDDDDSAGRAEENIATESENENTNPTPQDGDSNFVSNDSTSQEPILDENTTQTTATTTTDDGEDVAVGTPLASDSESNMEPPVVKANKNSSLPLKEANITTIAPNGNGALMMPASAAGLEGENSSSNCLRESEYEDDESSNSRALEDTQTPSIMDHNAIDNISSLGGVCATAAAATIVGQKRTLNCADAASLEDSAQPDIKKIRSD
ncbi:protein amun [Haematobia irritans]|uniref:protein amun n=1 Tax=Haematobia irritans TaxID=7368 RepID=UPI003F4FF132